MHENIYALLPIIRIDSSHSDTGDTFCSASQRCILWSDFVEVESFRKLFV